MGLPFPYAPIRNPNSLGIDKLIMGGSLKIPWKSMKYVGVSAIGHLKKRNTMINHWILRNPMCQKWFGLDGWMHAWTHGYMDAWIHGCMNAYIHGWMYACMHVCMVYTKHCWWENSIWNLVFIKYIHVYHASFKVIVCFVCRLCVSAGLPACLVDRSCNVNPDE